MTCILNSRDGEAAVQNFITKFAGLAPTVQEVWDWKATISDEWNILVEKKPLFGSPKPESIFLAIAAKLTDGIESPDLSTLGILAGKPDAYCAIPLDEPALVVRSETESKTQFLRRVRNTFLPILARRRIADSTFLSEDIPEVAEEAAAIQTQEDMLASKRAEGDALLFQFLSSASDLILQTEYVKPLVRGLLTEMWVGGGLRYVTENTHAFEASNVERRVVGIPKTGQKKSIDGFTVLQRKLYGSGLADKQKRKDTSVENAMEQVLENPQLVELEEKATAIADEIDSLQRSILEMRHALRGRLAEVARERAAEQITNADKAEDFFEQLERGNIPAGRAFPTRAEGRILRRTKSVAPPKLDFAAL